MPYTPLSDLATRPQLCDICAKPQDVSAVEFSVDAACQGALVSATVDGQQVQSDLALDPYPALRVAVGRTFVDAWNRKVREVTCCTRRCQQPRRGTGTRHAPHAALAAGADVKRDVEAVRCLVVTLPRRCA